MAKVKLGSKEFGVDCEEIRAVGCGVSDAECVALGARMKGGEFQRVKTVVLVSFSLFLHLLHLLGAESLQNNNQIGDVGASSLGEGLKCNSSVRELNLVSCGVYFCIQHCCWVQGMFLFEVVQSKGCFFLFLALNLYRTTTK